MSYKLHITNMIFCWFLSNDSIENKITGKIMDEIILLENILLVIDIMLFSQSIRILSSMDL